MPDLPADLLVITMTPDRRDPGGYRTTYVDAVRHGLEALIDRKTFYRLAAAAEEHEGRTGIWSDGTFFPLEP